MRLLLASTALAVGVVTAGTTTAEPVGAAHRGAATRISIDASRSTGPAPRHLLGVNHHYNKNGYALWDEEADGPVPVVVERSVQAHIDSVRFPGGTVASLYDWRRGVGEDRGCQVAGDIGPGGSHKSVDGLALGTDEFMEFVDAADALPLFMVPFVNDTAASAADWVEYVNAPVAGNPNGGVDWADVRARNGHPAPYGVHRWEIGNELFHESHRYWMSRDETTGARQFAFGGSAEITQEPLGKDCSHPQGGVPSDGDPDQTFETLYHPLVARSVVVTVDGEAWDRVGSLSSSGPDDEVFAVTPGSGTVQFGDGTTGAVPPDGAVVRASYRIVHDGYFAFVRAMKGVDPSIEVCSGWATVEFIRAAGDRSYDCQTMHAIQAFKARGGKWSGPLEGHDRFMLAVGAKATKVAEMLRDLPDRVPLLVTEASTISGDPAAFPTWATSASHAVYMAALWGELMKLHIPWANGDDLLWGTDRTVIGPAPGYSYTADAVTREGLAPMFEAGGKVLRSAVVGNPRREAPGGLGAYSALAVTATRAPGGALYVMVVNRLPSTAVPAQIRWKGFTAGEDAVVRRIEAADFQSWNPPGEPPQVTLRVQDLEVMPGGFDYTFPATSTTVFRMGKD